MVKLEDVIKPNRIVDISRRILKHVSVDTEGNHWIWKNPHNGDGQFFIRKLETVPKIPGQRSRNEVGKYVGARRLMYLLHYGEIPTGYQVTTMCKTGMAQPCINPEHLTLVEVGDEKI